MTKSRVASSVLAVKNGDGKPRGLASSATPPNDATKDPMIAGLAKRQTLGLSPPR